jgi:DNA-binding response OmpR family regulator
MTLDENRRGLVVDGRFIRLTPTEFDVVYVLWKGAGKTVPLDRLISKVWGQSEPCDARKMLHIFVYRIRKKTGVRDLIENIWRNGYRIDLMHHDDLAVVKA